MDSLPWVEKYRPTRLGDVSGQDGVVATVRQFVNLRQLPHLLFYGPPGTGKTSTIVAIAREIFGDSYKNMVLELNASDDRGIDVVRDQIKMFSSTRQIFAKQGSFKLVILDEADSMTNVAQNALRRIIEKYSAHTRFCILANYVHKLNPALVSRCTRFRFSPISQDAIKSRIQHVIEGEHVNISDDGLKALMELSQGDMRKALNVLQACYFRKQGEDSSIKAADIYDCVGSPDPNDIETIGKSLLRDDWPLCMDTIFSLKLRKGYALADILSGVGQLFMDVDISPSTRKNALSGLAEIEYRLANGGSEKLQTSAMIGAVKQSL